LYGADVLRKENVEVDLNDKAGIDKLITDMIDTLKVADGCGLAAPQVGVLRRVVLVDIDDDEGYLELINPEIVETSGEQTGLEGCLSVPGKWGLVTRPAVVKVRAQDRYGEWFEAEGEEIVARCFCHELAHLDGQLYTEVADKMLTPEELEEYLSEDE
jgi:peptide deformylase